MEGVRALIGAFELRTFPIHAVARETRFDVERIAFVGPPAVHAEREGFAMGVPSATDLLFIEASDVTRIADRSAQVVFENYRMQDNAKVLLMKFVDGLLGVGKNALVPGEGAVFTVPARGAKPRAEIDERVARKFFIAKGLCFGKHSFVAVEGAVRLLVAKSPERR